MYNTKRILFLMLGLVMAATLPAQTIKPFQPKEIEIKGNAPGSFKAAADAMEAEQIAGAKFGHTDKQLFKYANTITAEDLEAHLSFLASDELEGRETAMRGQKVAARYLAAQFQKFGLKPGNNGSWFQPFELVKVEVRDVEMTFDGKTMLKSGKDFAYFNKAAMAESFEAPLTFAGFGIADKKYNNLTGLDVKNKAVVVLSGEPEKDDAFLISGTTEESKWGKDYRKKVKALQEMGARAVILVLPDEDYKRIAGNPWLRHMMNGYSLNLKYEMDKEGSSITTVFVPARVADPLLKRSKKTSDEWRTALTLDPEVPAVDFKKNVFVLQSDADKDVVTGENVLGFIEGTDKKDEIVVLTAHYDHLGVKDGEIFNGADDDGTGVSTILEMAEAFALAAKAGVRPRRSILFMPVSGEEKGLLGSQYYADHPVYPLENTVCNLNIDMIGRIDKEHEGNENYVYIIGSDKLSTELHRVNEAMNRKVTKLELDYTYNDPDDPNRFYYRSDHYNFAKNNIPVIFYFTGVHEDYHKSTDTIEKILFPKTARIARLVFATAWELATREKRIEVDVKNDFPNDR
jgi:hypothetical protein